MSCKYIGFIKLFSLSLQGLIVMLCSCTRGISPSMNSLSCNLGGMGPRPQGAGPRPGAEKQTAAGENIFLSVRRQVGMSYIDLLLSCFCEKDREKKILVRVLWYHLYFPWNKIYIPCSSTAVTPATAEWAGRVTVGWSGDHQTLDTNNHKQTAVTIVNSDEEWM